MASHDGKRRSHQRFLRNLPKQKPGKYLKVILSSVADPDLALRKGGGGGGGFLSLGLPDFLPSAIPFFFFTQYGREKWIGSPGPHPLDPPLLLQE